jgi:hypothetical protein
VSAANPNAKANGHSMLGFAVLTPAYACYNLEEDEDSEE